MMNTTMSAVGSIASGLATFFISFSFACYILFQKEKLHLQVRKVIFAFIPKQKADAILNICSLTYRTFANFLAGQCLEAVILGMMFVITLSILKMPYALLIGILIAFTALVPIFGAFIGCAVGSFLIFMVNPKQAVLFIIVFLLLQQIEGNLIYPHVVGGSVGLPSIWVLAAVTIGGNLMGIIGMLIFILIILMGTSNAVNITDGLDGLAIMPMIICSTILGAISYFTGNVNMSEHLKLFYIPGSGEMSVFLATICGSGLGFLWYNFYPAQIFMGDTGSLTLGGVLGVVAILLKQELILPIIGGVFVMEALSVILQVGSFKLRGKRIFKMAPIHHHFELSGLAETKVTMRFWITTLIFGMVALGIIRLRGIL